MDCDMKYSILLLGQRTGTATSAKDSPSGLGQVHAAQVQFGTQAIRASFPIESAPDSTGLEILDMAVSRGSEQENQVSGAEKLPTSRPIGPGSSSTSSSSPEVLQGDRIKRSDIIGALQKTSAQQSSTTAGAQQSSSQLVDNGSDTKTY
ncbi:unnamed protein product, partial [Amoebophrya sp. A120]|eukprot:GSA120T00009089001.1